MLSPAVGIFTKPGLVDAATTNANWRTITRSLVFMVTAMLSLVKLENSLA
jgi:hypothetical protein